MGVSGNTVNVPALIYCRYHCKRGINEATLHSCLRTDESTTLTPPTARQQGMVHAEPNRDCENNESQRSRTLVAHLSFSNNKRHSGVLLRLCLSNWFKKKKKKENAIRTFARAFGLLTSTYAADLFFSPPLKRPHNASVLLPTRVTYWLNTIQLSGGNHGASVLTELKYYQPIWVSFHKYRNGCFPCGGWWGVYGGGGVYMQEGGRVTQVLGRRHYLYMYKWTTVVNKKHAVIPIDGKCRQFV